jgi:hypothetical protein
MNTIVNRTPTIEAFIRSVTQDALSSKAEMGRIAEEMKDASATNVNAREVMLEAVAARSHAETWTVNEVSAACSQIAKSYNDAKGMQAKAFATLAGEIKRAANEKVRGVFPILKNYRDLAWGAETAAKAADKDAPTPCRDAFARAYHMLGKMMSAAIDDNMVFASPTDVAAFVEANDPRLKPERVAKAIEKLASDVEYLNARMPCTMLKDILDFMRAHDAETIVAQVRESVAAAKAAAQAKAAADDGLLEGLDMEDAEEDAPNDTAAPAPVPAPIPAPIVDPVSKLLGFDQGEVMGLELAA